MQQQVYQVHDVDELKQRLIDVWQGFQQSVISVWKNEVSGINLTPYNEYFILPIICEHLTRFIALHAGEFRQFRSFVFCKVSGDRRPFVMSVACFVLFQNMCAFRVMDTGARWGGEDRLRFCAGMELPFRSYLFYAL